MNVSIKHRIYWSFILLVLLFVISGAITINTINRHQKQSNALSEVLDPSLQSLEDFKRMILESKMYTTNWVFLRSKQEDKDLLKGLHDTGYAKLKNTMVGRISQWKQQSNVHLLSDLCKRFEDLLVIEKEIMSSLQKFEDYDDLVTKLGAEAKIEEEVLPRTASLLVSLDQLMGKMEQARRGENAAMKHSALRLQVFILVFALSTVAVAILLSVYLARIIVSPINQISDLVNDMAKGISRKIPEDGKRHEIGRMTRSVNHLSEKLQYMASFAHDVGLRNFDTTFLPLSDEDTLGKALVAMRDNLKRTDQSLNEAQHIASLGSWEWDLRHDTLFWSDALYSIFEKSRDEFKPSFDLYLTLIHPDDKEQALSNINKAWEERGPFSDELRIVTDTGTVKTIAAQGSMVLDSKGEIVKMYGVAQDITERKKGELEIKKFNERFQRLSNATNDAIWDWNLVSNHVWWNESFYRIFGYDPHEDIPPTKEWTARIHPEDRGKVIGRLKEVGHGKIDSWEDEFRYETADGVYGTVLDRAYVMKDENGKPVRIIGALQDITARKKAEQQIADKNMELLQKNKELEQFAYVASHDLQEPLRTISSFTDMFSKQYKGKLEGNADKYLEYMLQASDRMKVLINDLLDYSRIGRKKELATVDCNILLRNVLADLDVAVTETRAGIRVGELPVISAYSTELKQLFQNLVINAIKFRKKDSVPEISISACRKDGGWEFLVRDNGIGIEPEHNERIFVIFQRLHNRSEYEGSGIGLSHCKKIVELHGGRIWVESVPGEGSKFYFTILENHNS